MKTRTESEKVFGEETCKIRVEYKQKLIVFEKGGQSVSFPFDSALWIT